MPEDKKEKKAIQILRDRVGGISPELKEYFKEQNRVDKLIKDALKSGPKTIPQIAQTGGLPPEQTTWHVMALKRYGEIVECSMQGDYYEYALKEA